MTILTAWCLLIWFLLAISTVYACIVALVAFVYLVNVCLDLLDEWSNR